MTIRYNGSGTAYYRCLRQMDKGKTVCDQPYIRADEIEAAVLDRVRMDVEAVVRWDETPDFQRTMRRLLSMQTDDPHITKQLLAKLVRCVSIHRHKVTIQYRFREHP
jgi:hypothetical protein